MSDETVVDTNAVDTSVETIVETPFVVQDEQVFINDAFVADATVTDAVVEEPAKTSYILHITSSDSLGLNLIENIIAMANLGATLKPQTLPSMRFPHSCSMVLEAEVPPTPTAVIRVFEAATNKEVFKAFVPKPAQAATFSLDADETEDKSTNDGKPWTKEQLDAMEWETEFKEVCKAVGITGRSRDKMTKQYLDKFA